MNIVGVIFKEGGKTYYFNSGNYELNIGDKVIVETEKGPQLGNVATNIKNIDKKERDEYFSVMRKASKEDVEEYEKNMEASAKAMIKAQAMAKDLGLEMTFIYSNYTFDRGQLIFYFVAEARVDFRELAKGLASTYRTRIELRQVGVRDKAKEVSGVGPCGRRLCCSSFLKDLDSVTIAMAKNQNLALNPNKINGLCGRLLCCLNFEDDMYREFKEDMPEVGQWVETKHGKGPVIFVDIPKRLYKVNVEKYGKVEVKLPSKCDNCGKKEQCNK